MRSYCGRSNEKRTMYEKNRSLVLCGLQSNHAAFYGITLEPSDRFP